MTARLQRYVYRASFRTSASHIKGMNLGMWSSSLQMSTYAYKLTILHHDSSDHRINSRLSLCPLRHVQRKPHVILVIDVVHLAPSPYKPIQQK
ncbi:hypothetical protein D3C78_1224550 [compost metagenome]